jgi:hypothetical protein
VKRGGVNGSQSKFHEGIWLISQIGPGTPLFLLDQDHIAIEQLLTLVIGLVITTKTRIDASNNTCETDDKTRTKNQFMSS